LIRKAYGGIIAFGNVLGTIGIVLITFVIFVDVFMRNVLNHPLMGTPEIVKMGVVAVTFLQIPHVLKANRHVRSTVIYDKVPPAGKRILDIFASLLGFVVFLLLFYTEISAAREAYLTKNYEGEGSLPIPTFPVHVIILFGSLFMTVQYGIRLVASALKFAGLARDEV